MASLFSRREILGAATAAASLSGRSKAASDTRTDIREIPIIDTHQHLWDLSRFHLPWTEQAAYRSLARNFLLNDYRAATQGLNIVKTVYVEIDVVPAQHVAEAEYVIGLCRQKDSRLAGAVISGRPASDEFAKYVRRFSGVSYVKGLREVLMEERSPRGYCLQEDFIRGIQLLGELGLTFDIANRQNELADAARLADACPDTNFILDHCGGIDLRAAGREQWKRDMDTVAKRKNITGCKISGFIASAEKGKWSVDDLAPVVDHTYQVFGPDRVMFASDWPVCTLTATFQEWLSTLAEIAQHWSSIDRQKLFHDNAVKIYRLT